MVNSRPKHSSHTKTTAEILQLKLRKRNHPPRNGIRIPYQVLERFIAKLFEQVGMCQNDAELLGKLLVQNDLRCVFSHGTKKASDYLRKIRDGLVNPCPELKVISESPGALVMDGDGGLGYFPCYHGTQKAIVKAQQCGIAALTTRNHDHFGAAGNYARLAMSGGCIGVAMSSHQTTQNQEHSVYKTLTDSPISVAIPSDKQPPLVLDMGGGILPFSRSSYERNPSPFFKALGLSNVIHACAGIFAGIYKPEFQASQSKWRSNQGAFIMVIDANHFMPVDELKKEMDRYIQNARSMKPLPGLDRTELAGGFEWQWEQDNLKAGIPVGPKHRKTLEDLAQELDVESPFSEYEQTIS